jgi:hypothetical protein
VRVGTERLVLDSCRRAQRHSICSITTRGNQPKASREARQMDPDFSSDGAACPICAPPISLVPSRSAWLALLEALAHAARNLMQREPAIAVASRALSLWLIGTAVRRQALLVLAIRIAR